MNLREYAKKYKQEVIDLRREFHKYPEASLYEYKTCEIIKSALDKIGVPYKGIATTGVVAEIKGKYPGKTVALRADIDGLSVAELNTCDFKSLNEGFMHACGHDCHAAMLLGAAMILNDIKDELKGTVRLMFQPAEEVAEGAKNMIAEGVLDGVDGVFGIHIWSDLEYGTVCVQEGPLMASADFFTINVKGKGGHGSAPHQGIDTALASSAIVMNLQSIVSREIDPLQPAVISVGSINAGTRCNVIASEGTLTGTTRSFNPEVRDNFPKMMERVIKETASAYRAEAELIYDNKTPVVINHPECTNIAKKSLETIGAKCATIEKVMGGEDFAEYLNLVPGLITMVGAGNKSKGACYPQHHPNFAVDEDALEIGSALYSQYAMDFLNHEGTIVK